MPETEPRAAAPRRAVRHAEHVRGCRPTSPRDRLVAALDVAIAARTMPPRRRLLRWSVARPAFVPAVDDETWVRHVQVAWRDDRAARAQLVESYLPNARALAKRAFRQREPMEDLVQVAAEALVLAIDRFDPERRKPFLGFANLTISGTLKRHYRDVGWGVRVPRRVHDQIATIRRGAEILHEDLGRPATVGEIADLLDIDEHDVAEAMTATMQREATSLDADATLEPVAAADRELALVEARMTVEQLLGTLDPEQRWILRRYYDDRCTQVEIARELGVSQMHVSRSLARSVRLLRSRASLDHVESAPPPPAGGSGDDGCAGGRDGSLPRSLRPTHRIPGRPALGLETPFAPAKAPEGAERG